MISPFEKIKRTFRYLFYKYKNNWHFPPNVAHITGGKMAQGTYEPEITHIIEKNLKKGDVFLDVGANIGYFSRIASRSVETSGHIYAFEPEYFNYHALCKNTAHLKNVTPLHFAISNEHKLLNFFASSHSSSHSIFNTSKNLNGSQFSIPSLTLDYFWLTYLEKEEINLIKIDVEGAEFHVLKGMEKMLSEDKVEAIVLEFHPEIILNAGENYQTLYSSMNKNFDIFLISEGGEMVQLNSNEQFNNAVEKILKNNKRGRLNFYFRRKQRSDEINY